MIVEFSLNNRQEQVLWATVHHYITTATPVGSQVLVEEYNLKVSSATIRNSMAILEKAGFLYQPHPSAGRIPSDAGYRVYVDKLISPSEVLATQVAQLLTNRLNWQNCSFEAALKGAAHILASLSGYIAMITMPQTSMACVRHLQLVQVAPHKIMLVVVTDTYETHSVVMDLPSSLNQENQSEYQVSEGENIERELQILSNFLNSQLKGRSLAEISLLEAHELDQEFEKYATFLRQLLATLSQRSQIPSSNKILISGLGDVLRLPEFSHSEQLPTLVQLLEEQQDLLWPLIFAGPEVDPFADNLPDPNQDIDTNPQPVTETKRKRRKAKGVMVRIGAENPLEPMRGCTLISAIYRRGNVPLGSVGVLGPTRMVYENAIAVVEAAANYLSSAFS